MKAMIQAKKQALPLFIVGLAFAVGNTAIAGPQSMLDPYFGVQPLKPDADGKKTKSKAAKTKATDDLKSAKNDWDSYPDSNPKESKIKANNKSLTSEPVKREQPQLAKEPVSKKQALVAKAPALAKEPVAKKTLSAKPDPEPQNQVGMIAGSKEMAHGLAVTTKGAATDIYHGAKVVGSGVVSSAKFVGHGLHKATDGTIAAGSKVKNGTLALGGKLKDGASDVAPKVEALPKMVASGVKTGFVKIKDGTVATGHAIAQASAATKDKIAGLFGGGGTNNIATASRPTDDSKNQ